LTGSPPPERTIAAIDAARRRLAMTVHELYLGYFAVGGNFAVEDVTAWLDGRQAMPVTEYDRLAQAVNDEAAGRGIKFPLRCSDDDGETASRDLAPPRSTDRP
jgi:hypothetical protein